MLVLRHAENASICEWASGVHVSIKCYRGRRRNGILRSFERFLRAMKSNYKACGLCSSTTRNGD